MTNNAWAVDRIKRNHGVCRILRKAVTCFFFHCGLSEGLEISELGWTRCNGMKRNDMRRGPDALCLHGRAARRRLFRVFVFLSLFAAGIVPWEFVFGLGRSRSDERVEERKPMPTMRHPILKPGWSGGGEKESAPGDGTLMKVMIFPQKKNENDISCYQLQMNFGMARHA